MKRLLLILFTLATSLCVGLIPARLVADPIDGKYYAEDQNEKDVIWKLYLKVAGNEVSARASYERYTGRGIAPSDEFECGSTELDTNSEFELWCGGAKLSGNLKGSSIWGVMGHREDQDCTGGANFKLIRNSELENFNRFKADTGIHKTAAYLDEKLKSEKK